ncbi:MAG: hypothetical protein ACR2PT_13265 [Endozoicomonas sp.]
MTSISEEADTGSESGEVIEKLPPSSALFLILSAPLIKAASRLESCTP